MRKLKMQLFGGFRLIGENAEINEAKYRSGMLVCLLAYILMNRGHVLSKQQLTETFLEKGSKNPETALKVLIHRLRNELKALGDADFILTSPGGYSWNPDIEVEADYEQLENMAPRRHLRRDQRRPWAERGNGDFRAFHRAVSEIR